MILTIDQRMRQRVRRLLGASPRARIAALVIGLLSAILVVPIVQFAFALLTPVAPLGEWRPRAPSDIPAETRAELFARIDPFYRSLPAAESASASVTSLQLVLFGVSMNEAAGTGSAIIAGADGVQASVGVGEEIQPGVRLAAVHFDYVEIEQNGKRELLYLDQSKAPTTLTTAGGTVTPPAPGAAAAPQAAAGNIPLSPSSIRAGIAFNPRSEGGRITGISVGQQGDGSAFQAAGFRSGDVVRSVNGRPITSASDINALAGQLQPGARLSLEVERGAGVVPIAIIIPNGNP